MNRRAVRQILRPFPLFLVLLPACGCTFPGSGPAGCQAEKTFRSKPCLVFKRLVVLGASISAGFGLQLEQGKAVTMADVFQTAFGACPGRALNLADVLLFLDPEGRGEKLVRRACSLKPTGVAAVDFLFWFGYGRTATESRRFLRLQKGLSLLDCFTCPILVGDLCDMSQAVGTMLAAEQVPEPETLKELNQRIYRWAEERPNVTVLRLSRIVERLKQGEPLCAGPRKLYWEQVFQKDKLHTTLLGTSALCVLALKLLSENCGDIPPGCCLADPEKIAELTGARAEGKAAGDGSRTGLQAQPFWEAVLRASPK